HASRAHRRGLFGLRVRTSIRPVLNAIRKSLRAKVIVIVMATAFAALCVATVVLLTYEVKNYEDFLQSDARTQAQLMAQSMVPALQFQVDQEMGTEILSVLENRPDVRAAAVYLPDGSLTGQFVRGAESFDFPPVPPEGPRIAGDTIDYGEPIVDKDGVRFGTLFIRTTYDVDARVLDYVLILIAVMFVSLLVAALISLLLAGSITGPMSSLTDVVRQVIERRDFTRRAKRT